METLNKSDFTIMHQKSVQIAFSNSLTLSELAPFSKSNFASIFGAFSKRVLIQCFLLLPGLLLADPGYVEPWGKDAGLIVKKAEFEIPPPSKSILGRASEIIIRFHQNVLSPTDGPRSHFRPTSSQYMLLAIRRYGFIEGYLKGCDRLLRENKEPWVYRTRVIDDIEWKHDPA